MKTSYKGVAPARLGQVIQSKTPTSGNMGGDYTGQMKDGSGPEPFAKPANMGAPAELKGMSTGLRDNGDRTGFITDGYLDKQGTPYGEAAKFNYLPPGMEITNQENAEFREMPLKFVTAQGYPGDGWGEERDVPE